MAKTWCKNTKRYDKYKEKPLPRLRQVTFFTENSRTTWFVKSVTCYIFGESYLVFSDNIHTFAFVKSVSCYKNNEKKWKSNVIYISTESSHAKGMV